MSSLEKTLRQIDEQRQSVSSTAAFPGMRASTTEPLLVHTLLHWLPATLAIFLTAAAGGGGYWLYRTGMLPTFGGEPSRDSPATSSAQPSPPLPLPFQPEVATGGTIAASPNPAVAEPPVPEWPEGFEPAFKAWTSGQHTQAGQLWLDALRRLPPSTMAVLLANRQTAEQVNNVVLASAATLPWLVIPSLSEVGERWTVLVLTWPADLDRTYALLARSGGPALQWGTLAHWVAASEGASHAAPPPSVRAGPVPNTVKAPSQPVTPPLASASVRPTPLAVVKSVTSVSAPTATTATPVAPGTGAPPTVAAPPSPSRVEPPQVSRTQAGEAPTAADSGAPSAAQSIESEFAAIERELAAARYDSALSRVSKLADYIGNNWRTRYLAGVALSGLSRWREAEQVLTLARQGNPSHSRVALYLSVAQQELGQHEAAIETLTQSLVAHSKMPELWLNKAHSLQALERGEEAFVTYRRFLDLSANRQDLSAQRAWVQKLLDTKGRVQ